MEEMIEELSRGCLNQASSLKAEFLWRPFLVRHNTPTVIGLFLDHVARIWWELRLSSLLDTYQSFTS